MKDKQQDKNVIKQVDTVNQVDSFSSAFQYKMIYIYKYDDSISEFKGWIKIGETTVDLDEFENDGFVNFNSEAVIKKMQQAAFVRIKQIVNTAGLWEHVEILHVQIAIDKYNNSFSDRKVHELLENKNIKRKKGTEWFKTSLDYAKQAIQSIVNDEILSNDTSKNIVIVLRDEQKVAIDLTIKEFSAKTKGVRKLREKHQYFLWDAKMRFGKTLTTMKLIEALKVKRTLIITHRPVVKDQWRDEFDLVKFLSKNYDYVTKDDLAIYSFEKYDSKFNDNTDYGYIYFASIQDLRGSEKAGGKFNKNDEVFNNKWDLVVIDEAHEGTQTDIGKELIEQFALKNPFIKELWLSGTPYNIIQAKSFREFKKDKIFRWDYVDEQLAKAWWDQNHPDEPNPYADLPQLKILTYKLDRFQDKYSDIYDDKAFDFNEFFRLWTGDLDKDKVEMPDDIRNRMNNGEEDIFVHEDDVKTLLKMFFEEGTNYPFSTKRYRESFRHTFWILPRVKHVRALKKLIDNESLYSAYQVVNVAGTGDDEKPLQDAKKDVLNAIGDKPWETKTIRSVNQFGGKFKTTIFL